MLPLADLLLTAVLLAQPLHGVDGGALQATAEGVLAAVPPPTLEPGSEGWTGSLSGSASQRSANQAQRHFNAEGQARLRRERDRLRGDAFWRYSDQENESGGRHLSARHFGGNLQYDYFLDVQEYFLWNASGERDFKSKLDLRMTSGVGYGYQFKEHERLEFAAELGAGWFFEDFEQEQPSERASARLAVNWSWKPRELWALEQRVEYYPSLEDASDSLSRVRSQVRYDWAENWFALASWRYQLDSVPAEHEVRADHDIALTLGWSF